MLSQRALSPKSLVSHFPKRLRQLSTSKESSRLVFDLVAPSHPPSPRLVNRKPAPSYTPSEAPLSPRPSLNDQRRGSDDSTASTSSTASCDQVMQDCLDTLEMLLSETKRGASLAWPELGEAVAAGAVRA